MAFLPSRFTMLAPRNGRGLRVALEGQEGET
jgi:hypothetical protein